MGAEKPRAAQSPKAASRSPEISSTPHTVEVQPPQAPSTHSALVPPIAWSWDSLPRWMGDSLSPGATALPTSTLIGPSVCVRICSPLPSGLITNLSSSPFDASQTTCPQGCWLGWAFGYLDLTKPTGPQSTSHPRTPTKPTYLQTEIDTGQTEHMGLKGC